MKLHADKAGTQNLVTACEAGCIAVNGRLLTRSLLLLPDHLDEQWGPDAYDHLTVEHLSALTAYSCDVVLIGTGTRQRFPALALLRPLMDAGLGFEIMDTAAACRTYNILVAEGRRGLAALVIDEHDQCVAPL